MCNVVAGIILILILVGGPMLIDLLTVWAVRRAERREFGGTSFEDFLKKEKSK